MLSRISFIQLNTFFYASFAKKKKQLEDIIYKKLSSEHLPYYKKIRKECLLHFPDNFGTKPEEEESFNEGFYKLILEPSEKGFFIGVFIQNELKGICGFKKEGRYKTNHRGEIVQVYLDPAFHHKGIAEVLLNTTIRCAFESPAVEQILLSAVYSNQKAVYLYQKTGFEIYGQINNYFKDGDCYWPQVFMFLTRSKFFNTHK